MFCFFFFNDTATTEIYTLSLHDALPISLALPALDPDPDHRPRVGRRVGTGPAVAGPRAAGAARPARPRADRKSTRLNSSHANISYAVFCLKKKNNQTTRLCTRVNLSPYS